MVVYTPNLENYGALAAGTLDPVFSLMLKTRATFDARSTHSLAEAEMIATGFFETCQAQPLRADALGRTMERINNLDPCPLAQRLPDYIMELPEDLRQVIERTLADRSFVENSPGHRHLKLRIPSSTLELNGGGVFLVELTAGQAARPHRHLGDEYTVVIRGVIQSAGEPPSTTGALIHRPQGSVHQPRASVDGDCVLLVILTGGLEFVPADGQQISA